MIRKNKGGPWFFRHILKSASCSGKHAEINILFWQIKNQNHMPIIYHRIVNQYKKTHRNDVCLWHAMSSIKNQSVLFKTMGVSKIETWIFQSFPVLKCNSPGIPESPGACFRGKLLWTFNWHRYQKTKQMAVRKRETALKHDCCILVSPVSRWTKTRNYMSCLLYYCWHSPSLKIIWYQMTMGFCEEGGIIRSIKTNGKMCGFWWRKELPSLFPSS